MPTGSQTKLITLRGPSGSGKSTVAARLRTAYGRGICILSQDMVRREILRERDHPGAVNIALIGVMARHVLEQGVHVVLEGILAADRYQEMITGLLRDHRGESFAYFFDIPYEETVARHWTKPNSAEFSPEDMRNWYVPGDVLPGGCEQIITRDSSLEETVARILAETDLLAAARPARSGFTEPEPKAAA